MGTGLVDALQLAFRIRSKLIFANLATEVAGQLETVYLLKTDWEAPPSFVEAPARAHRRADRDRRDQLDRTASWALTRSRYTTSLVGRRLGVRMWSHYSKLDHANRKRYLLAQRRVFKNCVNIVANPDDSRISGRAYQLATISSPDVYISSWAAPQE